VSVGFPLFCLIRLSLLSGDTGFVALSTVFHC
jgi:hypothetical protein